MLMAVTTVHVFACIVLVLSVLLQAGKGADMGAVFGGASTTIFGGSGAGNFLTRITTGAAVLFMLTSLTLTYGPQRAGTSSVMPESAVVPGAVDPALPGDIDAGAGAPVESGDAAVVGDAPVGEDASDAAGTEAAAPPAEAPAAAPAGDAAAPPAEGGAPAADSAAAEEPSTAP